MMTLAQTAEKVVGLTGTLYGGVASSLYGMEFVFNPRVRQNYPWGIKGQAGWVRDMGALERIVEYRPEYDKGGHYTGKRRIEQKPKEAPGCSPLLVREIIDHTVFVGLQDIGRDMPEFEEIPVPIPMDADMALHYNRAKDKLGTYLFQCRMEGDASFLGTVSPDTAGLADCAVPGRDGHPQTPLRPRERSLSSKSRCTTCPDWPKTGCIPKSSGWSNWCAMSWLKVGTSACSCVRRAPETSSRVSSVSSANMSPAPNRSCSRAAWLPNAARAWSSSSWKRASTS